MPYTILLIEDNLDIREATAELLELEGYRVFTAEDGQSGLQQAGSLLPHLVICDILMGGTDGYAVFSALLARPETRHIPFIFMTAMSENLNRARALEMGTCEYLVKPFDTEELFRCVARLLPGTTGGA